MVKRARAHIVVRESYRWLNSLNEAREKTGRDENNTEEIGYPSEHILMRLGIDIEKALCEM